MELSRGTECTLWVKSRHLHCNRRSAHCHHQPAVGGARECRDLALHFRDVTRIDRAQFHTAPTHVRFTPESGHVHCTAHVLQAKASAIKDKLVRRQKFYIQFTFGAARSVVQAFQGQPAAAEPSQCGSWWSTF